MGGRFGDGWNVGGDFYYSEVNGLGRPLVELSSAELREEYAYRKRVQKAETGRRLRLLFIVLGVAIVLLAVAFGAYSFYEDFNLVTILCGAIGVLTIFVDVIVLGSPNKFEAAHNGAKREIKDILRLRNEKL